MPHFGEFVYGPDDRKPTEEELEKMNKGKDTKIKIRPGEETIVTTEELPDELKEDDKESMEEILKKHGVDKIE